MHRPRGVVPCFGFRVGSAQRSASTKVTIFLREQSSSQKCPANSYDRSCVPPRHTRCGLPADTAAQHVAVFNEVVKYACRYKYLYLTLRTDRAGQFLRLTPPQIPSTFYVVHQMHISFEPVSPANRHVGQHDGLANALQESTTPNVMPDTHVFSRGSSETQDSGSLGFPRHRQLANVEVWIRVTGLDPMEYVLLQLKITKLDGGIAELQFHLDADNDGVARVLTAIDEDCLNDQQTGVCEGCTLEEELLICSDTSDCGDDFAVSVSSQGCAYLCKVYLSHSWIGSEY